MKLQSFAAVFLILGMIVFSGCGGSYNGQLLGELDRPNWQPEMPYGMVYIPSGFLHIGPSDQDVNHGLLSQSKSISIQGFFMDDTEITNNEYRQFVHWVRDSIAHKLLDNIIVDEESGSERIDWSIKIDWQDAETKELLEAMNYPSNDQFGGGLNTSKFIYKYVWVDWQTAAKEPNIDRNKLLMEEEEPIYPDTLVWIRDFSYSYNEPLARNYYSDRKSVV